MNAVTAIHEQHAATKQRLAAARDDAASRLSAHERASETKAAQLAEIEAAYVAFATSEALGLEPTQELPDANVLEKLRADAAVAEPVRRQLVANLEMCEGSVKRAEAAHKAAVGDYLRDAAVNPALQEFQTAFLGLRDAAAKIMAAHHLAYRKYNDNAPLPSSPLDLYGPVAEWLFAVNRMDWPLAYPYSIRPDWLPMNGRFWPDELPGVAERVAELLAEVEQVPA